MSRTSHYDSKIHDHIAWALALEGKTDVQIAEIIGITERTLNNWKSAHESFFQSLKNGKEVADVEVVKSLYNRAIGKVVVKNKKVIVEMAPDGTQRPARIETTEQPVPPDVTAAIFWLKNRRPDKWRERHDVQLGNDEWITALQSLTDNYEKNDSHD